MVGKYKVKKKFMLQLLINQNNYVCIQYILKHII